MVRRYCWIKPEKGLKAGLFAMTLVITLAGEVKAQGIDWIRQFGTSDDDVAHAISVDATGVYVVGYTFGTLPGQTSAGGGDVFVGKYDANGNQIWTRQFGSSEYEQADDISADATGVYVVGVTRGTLPGQTFAGGIGDAYVRKYDTDGNEVWTRQFGTSAYDGARDISVDSTGVYVAGETFGTLPGQTSAGGDDAFVRKYDTDGNEVWTHQSGSSVDDEAFGISVDATGVYVVGITHGTLPGQTSAGGDDAFVRKYDTDGNEVWTRQFGTPDQDVARDISVDATGVYVAGRTDGTLPGQTSAGSLDAYVRKYDANGNVVWTNQFGSSNRDESVGISADATGVYVAGRTDGTLPGQTSASGPDAFVAKIESVMNHAPVADAGPDQTVHVGTAVTLDGSGSHDPDENYPLTFSWEIISYPGGSAPTLSGANTASPTFTPDMLGDYTIQLIVTDNLGLSSVADTVTVSTFNTAPTADAGPDQVIIEVNTLVQLDGTQSYDLDGDNFTYEWTMLTRPVGSVAILDDPASPTPTLVADVHGNYEIRLVVTDIFGGVSDPDTALVSFENVPPVADPGDNQAVSVGSSVYLDGSGSSDANLDSLTYSWSLVSVPSGSGAVLSDPNSPQTTFVADVAGTYIVSLTVNDGFGGSDTANVTVVASSVQDELVRTLQDLIAIINGFDPSVFKNQNMQNALTNKINAVIAQVEQGLYQEALDKLENDILGKTDGCALTGAPDKNDWILTCPEQNQIYPLITYAIDLLNSLIDVGG